MSEACAPIRRVSPGYLIVVADQDWTEPLVTCCLRQGGSREEVDETPKSPCASLNLRTSPRCALGSTASAWTTQFGSSSLA
jgi:hypothetical protein